MAKWWMKAAVQKGISFLPAKEKINFLFQKYVTKGVALDDTHFGYKLEAARDHLQFYRKYARRQPAESEVLELGTGWYPIVPTLLYLAGFKRIHTIDIRGWMNRERQHVALTRILEYYDNGSLARYVPHILPDRIAAVRNLVAHPEQYTYGQVLEQLRIDARIMDATQLSYENDSFDLICSNNTFEHVYPGVLKDILQEFKRVLKRDGGIMSHFIDLSDHFAHLDDSISIYHFLRYSSSRWALIDNDIQPQNRLRWPDYLRMYAEVGLTVREEQTRDGDLQTLSGVPVHREYSSYTPRQLAISHGYLIT